MKNTLRLLIKIPMDMDREVRAIVESMFPDFDFTEYALVFEDIERLYEGEMPGFSSCDTPYHDWSHTLGTLLAAARLLHGIHLDRHELSRRIVRLTLIAALFHDAGYIRRQGETDGTGARFTQNHVQRGIDLLNDYGSRRGWTTVDIMDMESILQCTDPASEPDAIVFSNIETMLAAHALATADLVSQMADDVYLEKLPLLFREFSEAGIAGFPNEYSLLRKTMGFYAYVRLKTESRLSNVIECMPAHFLHRHGVERDFYAEAIRRNMDYLSAIIDKYGPGYARGLRRRLDREEFPIDLAARIDRHVFVQTVLRSGNPV